MPLDIAYSPEFERLWKVWLTVRQPKARSKKAVSYKAFKNAEKLLNLTPADLDKIIADIEARKRSDARWQIDHGRYVPMLATYLNQRWWNEPFGKAKQHAERSPEQQRNQAAEDEYRWWCDRVKLGADITMMPEHVRVRMGR